MRAVACIGLALVCTVAVIGGWSESLAQDVVAARRFNVLDQVEYDPRTGQIRLAGHFDPNYAAAEIPYLDYLATLLDNPRPVFSLEVTPEANADVAAITARFKSDKEWKGITEEWGEWLDDKGRATPTGRLFLQAFSVSAPVGAPGPDPWAAADRYEIAARILAKAGAAEQAKIIDEFGRTYRNLPNLDTERLSALIAAVGVEAEFAQVLGSVKDGTLSAEEGFVRAGRVLCEKLDGQFEFAEAPVTRAFEEGLKNKKNSADALADALTEFDRRFEAIFRNAIVKLWHATPELHVSISEITPSLRDKVKIPPYYGSIEKTSLLAKLMFEADYFLKFLGEMPQLAEHIPSYQTEFTFYRDKVWIAPKSDLHRVWISVDSIEAARSRDGNVLAFGETKMRINRRARDPKTLDDLPDSEPKEYLALLNSIYGDLEKIYPQYFHALREAGKLSYAAQWLQTKNVSLRLPAQPRGSWNPPPFIAGFFVLSLAPLDGGRERSVAAFSGGVEMQSPPPNPNLRTDPGVSSSGGRSGCKPGTGGSAASSIGASGGGAVILIDCDDFSRPLSFTRDSNGEPPLVKYRRLPEAEQLPRKPVPTSRRSTSAPAAPKQPESAPPAPLVSPAAPPAPQAPLPPIKPAFAAPPPPPPPAPSPRKAAAADCQSRAGTSFFGQAANPVGVNLCDDPAAAAAAPTPAATPPAPPPSEPKAAEAKLDPQQALCKLQEKEIDKLAAAVVRARLMKDVYSDRVERPGDPQGVHGFTLLNGNPEELRKLFPGVANLDDLLDANARSTGLGPTSHYHAAIYREQSTGKIFVGFRGTDDKFVDFVKGNVPQSYGRASEYYAKAKAIARLLAKAAEADKTLQVEFVGDSLGGGMAAAASLETCGRGVPGFTATTTNAAGVHPRTVGLANFAAAGACIRSYVVQGEPLNTLQDNRLKALAGLAALSTVPAVASVSSPLVEPALGSPTGLGLPTEHWWNLPAAILEQAFENDAFPPSAGQRIVLPVDWDGAPRPFPSIERHYMSASRIALDRALKKLRAQHAADCSTPVVSRGPRDIDHIFVPSPSISPKCDGYGCKFRAATASTARLANDLRVWLNDPLHKGWVNDAAKIGTAPLELSKLPEIVERGPSRIAVEVLKKELMHAAPDEGKDLARYLFRADNDAAIKSPDDTGHYLFQPGPESAAEGASYAERMARALGAGRILFAPRSEDKN